MIDLLPRWSLSVINKQSYLSLLSLKMYTAEVESNPDEKRNKEKVIKTLLDSIL